MPVVFNLSASDLWDTKKMLDKNNDLMKWYVHYSIQISEYDIVT